MNVQVLSKHQIWVIVCAILFIALATGCSQGTSAANPGPSGVEVVEVQQKDVPIYGEWIGTLDGLVNADIKAQVSGYLLKQDYTEGSFVRKGQQLFEIDPRPFQAAVDQAQGQFAQANGGLAQAKAQLVQSEAQVAAAEANQRKAQLDEDRYIPLAKQQAITQQDLDNAIQNNLAAKAQVQAAKAGVETAKAQIQAANAAVEAAKAAVATAQLNLGFTQLTSPIDGIAGLAQQQVGALVSPASGAVTTVSTLDPVKVYFTVSEQEYLDFNRRFPTEASRNAETGRLPFELILADGTTYPHTGKFFFADRQVNQTTGAIRLAALFPNPGNILRPGQYGRVRTSTRIHQGALLVPQRAVTELQGTYQVAVVDNENKVNIRTVKVGERSGRMWIIDEGLKPGERVVAEGVQKVGPGMPVKPLPYADAAAGQGAGR
ncbi:MAG: efflux RND transporter periplasmic adaptor subunit [Acidobacteriia bacterium]|nr:efflux RND transporter periplasmic adaptor subunit [Terriglobia bacterium]